MGLVVDRRQALTCDCISFAPDVSRLNLIQNMIMSNSFGGCKIAVVDVLSRDRRAHQLLRYHDHRVPM